MSGDRLPSWRETPARQAIVEFVAAVTDPGSDPADGIAALG